MINQTQDYTKLKTLLYVVRYRVLATLLSLLLALAPVVAQNVVYVGDTSPLSVLAEPGYSYQWELYDDVSVNLATISGNCPETSATFIDGNIGASVTVKWLKAGTYYFKMTVWDISGCSKNAKVGVIVVKENLPTATITPPDPMGICVGETAELEVNITGTGPWNLSYTDGTTIWKLINITEPTNKLKFTPEKTSTYWITEVSNINGTNTKESEKVLQEVNLQPQAFAGNDLNSCSGSVVMLAEATAENYSKIFWTSSGDGTFDDSNLLHPAYTPGPADLLSGEAELTLIAESAGKNPNCNPAVSKLKLNVYSLQVSASGTNVSCSGASDGIIAVSDPQGGSGSYEFNLNGVGWIGADRFTGLATDTYRLQMRDANFTECVVQLGEIILSEPEPLSASIRFTDATCIGNDGTITAINPQGGSGSYEFSVSGVWSNGFFSNLEPGSYTVQVRDANVPDCSDIIGSVLIAKPEILTADVLVSPVSCSGSSDGSILVTNAKNGSGTFEFSVDGNTWIQENELPFTNLKTGNYEVRMRDKAEPACVVTLSNSVITEPEPLQANSFSSNVSCFGGNDGYISFFNVTGGSGTYEFSSDDLTWQTGASFSGLVAGKYQLSVRDSNSPDCVADLGEIILSEPLKPEAKISHQEISCFGSNDGTIAVTEPKNGKPVYEFSIDGINWSDSGMFTALGPGSYTIRMRDANACVQELETLVLAEPVPLSATVHSTNATCLGNDGTITISDPQSGSGFYEYSIDNTTWFTNNLFTTLESKTYEVKIRDAKLNSCENTLATVVVSEPEPLSATVSVTDVSCFGGNDGALTLSNQLGGSGIYELSLDGQNWQPVSGFTELTSGTYTVQMRDMNAKACVFIAVSYEVGQPEVLSAMLVPKHVTCYGGNDGAIAVTNPKGGSGKYEYSVNGTDWFSDSPANLLKGDYVVQMRDAEAPDCIHLFDPLEIKQPDKIFASVEHTNVSCFGGSDGTISVINPLNGTDPYIFSLDSGVTWQSEGTFGGLPAGNYDLIVIQDFNICSALLDAVLITQPEKLEATVVSTNQINPDQSDATLKVTGQRGGSGEYEYSLGENIWQSSPEFTRLSPGNYVVRVRDVNSNSCVLNLPVNLLPAGSIQAKYVYSDISCYNGSDGSIQFTETSGANNYEYSIDGGSTWQASASFFGLSSQTYSLSVRDADVPANFSVPGSIHLKQPIPINASVFVGNETFPNAGDGKITVVSPGGGSGEYQYSIDDTNWSSGTVFTDLPSGVYTVWIRDARVPDCKISIQKIIQVAGSLSADVLAGNISCNGKKNGSITISNVSGANEYEYSIDGGASWYPNGNFTGLQAGKYNPMLRDKVTSANRIALGETTISEPDKLVISLSSTVPLCAGTSGSVSVSASGGSGSILGTGKSDMAAGEQRTFTVTDENGCTDSETFSMPAPEKIVATAQVNAPKCPDDNGSISIQATGGTGVYSGVGTFTVLPGKAYNFKVSDNNGCVSNTITGIMPAAPSKLVLDVVSADPVCSGLKGSGTVTVSSGVGLYFYRWDDPAGQTTSTASGLEPGTYTVSVSDESRCTPVTASVVINPVSGIAPVAQVSVQPSCLFPEGQIEITEPLGNPYEYSLNGNSLQAGPVFSGLKPGDYSLKVFESTTGCESETLVFTVNPVPEVQEILSVAVTTQPGCLVHEGTIEVSSPLGTAYEYSLDGANYQASPVFDSLVPGNYSLSLRVISSGCVLHSSNLIVNPAPFVPELPLVRVSVQPDCVIASGTLEVVSPLGNAYEYSLDGIRYQKRPVFAGLAPGDYAVHIKAVSGGCESVSPIQTVNPVPASPEGVSASATFQPNCLIPVGTIQVTAPPGPEYEYSLDGVNFQSGPVFGNLAPGNYSVLVKLIPTGCETAGSSIVINPVPSNPPAPAVLVTQPDCSVPTGTIRVTSPLGATYEYSSDGINYQSSPVFAGLIPGTYWVKVRNSGSQCESSVSDFTVNQAFLIPEAPVSTGDLAECAKVPVQTLDARSVIVPVSGVTVVWYDQPTGGIPVASPVLNQPGTKVFYAEANNAVCSSQTRTPVTLSIDAVPAAPVIGVTVHPDCNFPNGTVIVSSPKEGIGYEYKMDDGEYQSSATFAELIWGEHYVRVKNTRSGCESAATTVVVNAIPPAPVLAVSAIENCSCYDGRGSISFTVTNTKDGIYSIGYDGGVFANVSVSEGKATVVAFAGTYTNLSIDSNGCTSEFISAVVTQPYAIVISETVTEIDLKSQTMGKIDLQVSGGTGTFNYQWSNGETTDVIRNLNVGSYAVIVTDANGCSESKLITIPLPNFPPVAVADEYLIGCFMSSGNLIENDSDPDGDSFFADLVPVENPLHGVLTLNPDGTFEYQADTQFSGTDYFSYAIYDSKHYLGDTARVTLTVFADMDCDGVADETDQDADADGILNQNEGGLLADTDGDGLMNYLDIDSDNDGMVDHVEAQSLDDYVRPLNMDTDGDGVDDAFDQDQNGVVIVPLDTDGDGIPDFLDFDSDNDLVPDNLEGHDLLGDGKADHLALGKDSDKDGLDDAFDMVNRYSGTENMTGSNASMQDFDGDGLPDWRDDNDDDDLYLTRFEDLNADSDFSNDDTDLDGHPEYLDYGRDCDLFIPNIFTPNNDNIHDYFLIYCMNHYPNARMFIFDQIGNKIFEKEHYGNLEFWGAADRSCWNGKYQFGGHSLNELVPVGTYFYVLNLGNGEVRKSYVFVSY
ncbi:MAG: gliding motility-associated C-terminal domain-containing protein [Prolixibacteraceae bacterium]